MNLQERIDFEFKGIVCYGCGLKVEFPRGGWVVHVDPEFTDDGYLIEVHHRNFCSTECMDAWYARESAS